MLSTLFLVPFLHVLETAGCHNWNELCCHLTAIVWRQLTTEQFRPRSSVFWEAELTRLFSEYVRKGKIFEESKYNYRFVPTY